MFSDDPRYADAREALSVTGLPTVDVAIEDSEPFAVLMMGPDAGVLGAYDQDSDSLWRAPGKSSLLAAVHEYGHAIWYHANRTQKVRIRAVMKAADTTEEVRRFRRELNEQNAGSTPQPDGVGDYDYLLTPTEVWARALAQYVFTTPRQRPKYARAWHAFMVAHEETYGAMQWTDSDFAPLAAAFDREFPA